MADDIEARTVAQVARRFIPFLILCYFVAYLDRVNVGFAKLTMDADLGLSETAFGFGAGVFFLAYFLFEVPSNIIMDKVGAGVWIARIMFSWGIVSGAMAFIPNIARATGISAEYTFYLLRILLGFAEAGFFPGIIFFLTLWFPASYRARIVGYFMAAIPLSSAIGSPVSATLLGFDGAGGPGAGNGSSSSRRSRRSFSPSSHSSTSPTVRRTRAGWPMISGAGLNGGSTPRTRGASTSRRPEFSRASTIPACWRSRSSISAPSPATTA